MSIEVSEFINVEEQALKLNCNIPTGLAILPRNFEVAKTKDELLHDGSAATLRILLRETGIPETRIEKSGDKFPCIKESAITWIVPIIFIGAAVISENPHIVSITLGIISNYLSDFFKGTFGGKRVKFDFILEEEKDTRYIKISYDGDLEGLPELKKFIEVKINEQKIQ